MKLSKLAIGSFLLVESVDVVFADCCYTASPTFLTPTKFLLNLTVSATPDLAPSSQYNVQITFPATYIMEGSQSYRSVGSGHAVCETQRGNDYVCQGWGSEVFSTQWGGVVPDGNGVHPQVVLLADGQSVNCAQRDWCPLPSDSVDDGLMSFGPLGRHPRWFAVVLAAAGGMAIGLIVFAFLKYRNGKSGAGIEKDLAARHDETVGGGNGNTDDAVKRAASIRRVPTVREVKRGDEVGGKGTLLGDKLGVKSQQEVLEVGGAGTLVGAMLQQAALQRNGTISGRSTINQPVHPERTRSLKTLFDPVVNVSEYPPMSATGLQRSRSVKSVQKLYDPEAPPPNLESTLNRSKSTRSVREHANENGAQRPQSSLTRSKSTRSVRELEASQQQLHEGGLTRSKSSRSIFSSANDLHGEKEAFYWKIQLNGTKIMQYPGPGSVITGGRKAMPEQHAQNSMTDTPPLTRKKSASSEQRSRSNISQQQTPTSTEVTPTLPRKKSMHSDYNARTPHGHHHETQAATIPPYRARSKSRTRVAPESLAADPKQTPPLPQSESIRRRRSTIKNNQNKPATGNKKVQDLTALQDELEKELKVLLGDVEAKSQKRNGMIANVNGNAGSKEVQRGRAASRGAGRDGGW